MPLVLAQQMHLRLLLLGDSLKILKLELKRRRHHQGVLLRLPAAAAVAAPVLREVDAISDLKRMSEGNWSKGMDVLYTQTTLKSTEIR